MFIYEPQFIEDSVVSKFDAVVQVIDGEGYFMIGGEEHEVIEGQMIISLIFSSILYSYGKL